MDMFDDVAAFLMLAPLAIVLGVAAMAAYFAFRHRPAAVHVKPKNRLSD
jgi:heme/copper-type cytochrome/quinol oxidase subunit 2